MKELIEIQKKLNAPKGRLNTFGGYKYRSCEDILDAVKPLLYEHECMLTITDTIELIGERFYVKAIATIRSVNGDYQMTCAYAREEETKKGMDAAQITGSCSSYARKYALNGLFLIDDVQDPDGQKPTEEKKQPSATQVTPPKQAPPPAEPQPAPLADMEQVEIALQNMTESAQVQAYWKANKESHANPEFVKLITTYGKKLKDAGK